MCLRIVVIQQQPDEELLRVGLSIFAYAPGQSHTCLSLVCLVLEKRKSEEINISPVLTLGDNIIRFVCCLFVGLEYKRWTMFDLDSDLVEVTMEYLAW